MRTIQEYANQELVWVKPYWFKGVYELRTAEDREGAEQSEPLAQFRVTGLRHCEGTVAEGSFYFQQIGVWQPKLVITQGEIPTPLVTLSSLGNGGTLTFADGRTQRYVWRKARGLSNQHMWVDERRHAVVHVHPEAWKSSVKLRVKPRAGQNAGLGLLVLLAGYLVIQAWNTAIVVA